MGRKNSNLGYQLTSAISACTYDGHSKRSYRQSHGGDTGYRIFGFTYKGDLCETAKELGKFIHYKYPDIRLVRDIKPYMVQEYMDYKSRTCNIRTIEKIYSHIRKIDLVIQHKYKAKGYSDHIHMPDIQDSPKLRDKMITDADFDKLINSLSKSRSGAVKSAILSRYAGLRLEETNEIRMDRFSDKGGKWGYGTFDVLKGDGAKGNRIRHLDIATADGRDAIRGIVKGLQPGQLIVFKADGTKYDKKSITRTIERHMDKLGMVEYKQNRNHAMRKAFAQECYDLCRRAGDSKPDALGYVNKQLGHGYDRKDIDEVYVLTQW